MGKATRWLKALFLTLRGPDSTRPEHPARSRPPKEKRRWSFVKSYRDKSSSNPNPNPNPNPLRSDSDDASKHAIVVAAASAADADAAVAAAQAAAAVVRLTTTSRRVTTPQSTRAVDRTSWAVVLIQSRFRGYLARRALKALKGLVKLQAHVRGHIERKRTAETMRRIQAMLRAQARARSVRSNDSPNSSGKSSQIHHHPGPPTPEKFEPSSYIRGANGNHSEMLKGNGSRSIHRNLMHPDKGYVSSSWSGPQLGESLWDPRGRHTQYHHHHHHPREDYYVRPDKILEVDTGKPAPQFGAKHRKNPNPFESTRGGLDFYSDQLTQSFTTTTSREDSYTHQTTVPSPGSCEVQSGFNTNTLKLSVQEEDLDDDGAFCTAENSPRVYSSSSRRRRGTHTPTKSDASATSCFSGYSDCPSYMNYTESSRAKMRSMSAPRQRPQQQQQQQQCYERGSSMKRWSVHQQRAVVGLGSGSGTMQASFASRAYPGSGHLDRLGMPVRNSNAVVYYSGYLN